MCGAEEKSLPQQGLFTILSVTLPVNTLMKCNHSQEEKGRFISIKESLFYNSENVFNIVTN